MTAAQPSRYGPDTIDEQFAGPGLDLSVWTAAYLPARSPYADAAPAYAVGPDGLRLSLPPDHPRWCPASTLGLHPALRPDRGRAQRDCLEVESPDDCGEICVVEVFGDTLRDGRAGLGCASSPTASWPGRAHRRPTIRCG